MSPPARSRGGPRSASRAASRGALLLLAIAGLFVPACSRGGSPKPAKHVVLIVVDTLRADRLSCYGYARPTSPAIDALAKEGVRFENAVAQSSWTSPSMVSMMTSRYVADEVLAIPDEVPVLAERFREAGFATGAFITNDILNPENRFERGFDEFQWELVPYGENAPILDWLAANRAGKSFTFVHLAEPHDEGHEYKAPERFRRWKDARDGFAPDRLRFYESTSRELALVEDAASRARIEEQNGAYDDDVACVDDRIGEILDVIRASGQWDETAVVLAADHGEGLWTYVQFPIGSRAKAIEAGEPPTLVNTLHQTHGSHVRWQLVHVPLIVKGPGLRPAVVESFVENVDVAPTLLALAGLAPLDGAQGQSLLPFAADPGRKEGLREAAFTFTMYNTSLVGQDGVQLVLPTARGECEFNTAPEFYDVVRDPESRVDLSARERGRLPAWEALVNQRLASGLHAGSRPVGPASLKALGGLGYLEAGMFDLVRETLAGLSTEELVEQVVQSKDCLVRLQAIGALRERDLSPELKEALGPVAAQDRSRAVRSALAALLR